MSSLHADPGLQPERTSLSWHRTQASLIIVSVLFVRWYPGWGVVAFAPVVFSCAAVFTITATQKVRYNRSCRSIEMEPHGADVYAVLLITLSCSAVGLVGLAVLTLSPR